MKKSYLALVIGVCSAIAAAISIWSAVDFRLSSDVTTGTVVGLSAGEHHPRIAFDAENGRHYERPTGTIRSFKVGEIVSIRYNPNDPGASAMIDSTLDLWAPSIFLLILAVGFLDAGLRGESPGRGIR
jgi:hypothetical protein